MHFAAAAVAWRFACFVARCDHARASMRAYLHYKIKPPGGVAHLLRCTAAYYCRRILLAVYAYAFAALTLAFAHRALAAFSVFSAHFYATSCLPFARFHAKQNVLPFLVGPVLKLRVKRLPPARLRAFIAVGDKTFFPF